MGIARMVGHAKGCWCHGCRRPSPSAARRRRVAEAKRVEKRAIKRGERQKVRREIEEELG